MVWPVLRSDGRYNIHTRNGAVTTRQTLVDAQAFCKRATLEPGLLIKKKKVASQPRRESRHPPRCPEPPLKRRAPYGSLVSKTKKQAASKVDSFVAVVDHLERNPHQKRTVLGSLALAAAEDGKVLQAANRQLQADFDRTKRVLLGESVFDPSGVVNSKAMEAIVGEGYAAQQERTFRRHRHCLLSKLREICADDTLRQLQLLQGCLQLFASNKNKSSSLSARDTAAQQVLQGIHDTLEKIKLLHGQGRTPHDLRVAQQTLQAAALAQVVHVQSEHIAAMLATSSRHQLVVAHQRGKAFLNGESELPYEEDETSCNAMDPIWAAKVSAMWISGTRPSENKKDELKNPKDRSDPTIFRVRFMERGLEQMVVWMNETGQRDLCPEFQVSRFYIKSLKPFFVKRPGR